MLHPRIGDSDKIALLTDAEFRVWVTYVLAADDFGVMPMMASKIQSAHRALSHRPAKQIVKALEQMAAASLLAAFTHQSGSFVWTPSWQFHQKIRFPRVEQTHYPAPPEADLAGLTEPETMPTRVLFATFHARVSQEFRDQFGDQDVIRNITDRKRKRSGSIPRRSGDVPEKDPKQNRSVSTLARAGAPETAHANGSRLPATGFPIVARRNLNAAFEGPRGLYVLNTSHAKFLKLLNGKVSESELLTWYEQVSNDWATGPHRDRSTGSDMAKFWGARFDERWPGDAAAKGVPQWAR